MANPQLPRPVAIPALTVPEDLQPVYSNMVRISHLPSEMVFDFAMKLPGAQPGRVVAQVIMSPLSAKLFQRAMTENLAKYESVFGEIKIPGEVPLSEYSKLFRPPGPPPESPGSDAPKPEGPDNPKQDDPKPETPASGPVTHPEI